MKRQSPGFIRCNHCQENTLSWQWNVGVYGEVITIECPHCRKTYYEHELIDLKAREVREE